MGKLKSVLIVCLALCSPFLAGSGSAAGDFLRNTAMVSAGLRLADVTVSQQGDTQSSDQPGASGSTGAGGADGAGGSTTSTATTISGNTPDSSGIPANNPVSPAQRAGTVITQNRLDYKDTADYSKYTEHSGKILRYNFGRFNSNSYINLESGAQVRNCTTVLNSVLEETARIAPDLDVNTDEPVVLIYHTHTSESFLPEADWYDKNYPLRCADPSKSIVAVGDAICAALAERGISSVHDCTVHDDPYTGAYYRSEKTILEALRTYPSIRLVLDIHRDGIGNSDGSLPAPVATIDGRSAAQFMIISGCESEMYDMPDYLENFKLACLIQNCAEERYPTLSRPILFDYRNYNQNLSTGALLIEVGSHGNSLDEVVYTGKLLGNVLADVVYKLEE